MHPANALPNTSTFAQGTELNSCNKYSTFTAIPQIPSCLIHSYRMEMRWLFPTIAGQSFETLSLEIIYPCGAIRRIGTLIVPPPRDLSFFDIVLY